MIDSLRRVWLTLRLGAAVGRGRVGALHRGALLVAAFATVVVGWTFVAVGAVAEHRSDRILARGPVFTEDPADALAYWHLRTDFLADRQFLVIHVAPVTPTAVPPAGLARWPAPGEVFVSPALLAADATVPHRYGEYAGAIADDGLADSTEWLVYTRPHDDGSFPRLPDRSVLVAEFGQAPGQGPIVHQLPAIGRAELPWLLVLTIGLPLLILVVVAVRTGAERRDRRLALLDGLGAPYPARGWLVVGEAAAPVAVGAALGVGAGLLTTIVDTPVPGTGWTVWATDLTGIRWWLAPLWFAVVLGVLALAALVQVRPAAAGPRPRALAPQLRYWPQVVFPLALTATILTASFGAGRTTEFGLPPIVVAFLVSLIVTLATLPAVTSAVISWLGRRAAQLNSPAALVGGRWLASQPTLTARLVAAVAVGLGITGQLAVVTTLDSFGTGWLPQAATDEAVVIYARGASDADRERFVAAVGHDRALAVHGGAGGYRPLLVADCGQLRRLGDPTICPSTPTPPERVFNGDTALERSVLFEFDEVTTGPAPTDAPVGYFVLNPAGPAGLAQIQQTTHRTLPLATAHVAGQIGAMVEPSMEIRVRWMTAAGATGLLLLVVAGGVAVLSLVATQSRSLGALGGIGAPRRLFTRLAVWNVGLPLLLTLGASVAMAAFLARLAVRLRGSGRVPWEFLTASAVICLALAAVITTVATLLAIRAAPRWRPAAD